METRDYETLESLIDKYGIGNILDSLASVAYGKANHIESSYSDRTLSGWWRGAAKAISRLVNNQYVRAIQP